jgi:hypothetical protein
VTVTLARPVPLSRRLFLVKSDGRAALVDGDTSLATVEAAPELSLEPPRFVSVADAMDASARFPATGHPFPRCFVCGPDRDPSDALRLLTGPTADASAVAARWVPSPSLCRDVAGRDVTDVPIELVWSALDCPGAWSIFLAPGLEPRPMVLGRITGQIFHRLRAGEPHVVMGAFAGRERRKHFCQTAVYDGAGRLCAGAKSTWIALE